MQKRRNILVVGAGFSGAVIARYLSERGYLVDIVDQRKTVGGNCYTYRDQNTDILVHKYGPHIFHTNDDKIWKFVNRFGTLIPYRHSVFVTLKNNIYRMPINLHTINQFFNAAMTPSQARNFITNKIITFQNVNNFEEQALSIFGPQLYEAFIKGYTQKQWGTEPKNLPANIILRLPFRFNYDDNYFVHKLQGIPIEGYTSIVEALLCHKNINLILGQKIHRYNLTKYEHVFVSAPLDEWYDHSEGRLNYRTLNFEEFIVNGDFQGCSVMNYADPEIPFTRITEHKHFAPSECHEKSIVFREYSKHCEVNDIPFYPTRLHSDKAILKKYIERANSDKNITFVGRLGTYRYIDMDVAISEALKAAKQFVNFRKRSQMMPAFIDSPI